MKKALLLMLVFLAAGTVLVAQNVKEMVYGFRGGMLIGFHSAGGVGDMSGVSEDSAFNFNLAFYGARAMSDKVSIQGELNFMINQGMELTYEQSYGNYTYKVKNKFTYSSLDIPVLVKYTADSGHGVFGGLHLSIPIGKGELKTSDYNDYADEWDSETAKFEVEGVSLGFTGGVFGKKAFRTGHLVGDVRLLYDFSGPKIKGGTEFIVRRGLAITVGYEW